MKLKTLLFICCLGLLGQSFADNRHFHPKAVPNEAKSAKAAPGTLMMPDYCEIEVINRSYDDVRVYGVFDDGSSMQPFSVYSREAPHYIDMFYYGYCHAGMNLYIDTFSGYRVFSGYTPTQSTVDIVPFFGANKMKVEIRAK